jgi:hypothetical protein
VVDSFNLTAHTNASHAGEFPGRAVPKREKLLQAAMDVVAAALSVGRVACRFE